MAYWSLRAISRWWKNSFPIKTDHLQLPYFKIQRGLRRSLSQDYPCIVSWVPCLLCPRAQMWEFWLHLLHAVAERVLGHREALGQHWEEGVGPESGPCRLDLARGSGELLLVPWGRVLGLMGSALSLVVVRGDQS